MAAGQVPQPHRAIGVGAGQQPAEGAERHRAHAVRVAGGVERYADGRPVAGFHSRTVPSPSALASSLPPGLNATARTLYGSAGSMPCCCCSAEQGRDGGRGLAGGEDAPGGDGELARDHGIGGGNVEAFGGELAGQGEGVLPRGGGGVVDGDPGGGDGDQGEDEKASDHGLTPTYGSAVGMAAGVEEVTFGLAERRVAAGSAPIWAAVSVAAASRLPL